MIVIILPFKRFNKIIYRKNRAPAICLGKKVKVLELYSVEGVWIDLTTVVRSF